MNASLPEFVIAAALYDEDLAFAESLCLRLVAHEDETIRGNAILGFGHIARRGRRLGSPDKIRCIIEAGLSDPSDYVRGQAHAASDDIETFTK